MKFIGKDNLIEILCKFESETVSEKTIELLMDWYGDNFELDDGENWVRSKKNDQISNLLGDKYSDIGDTITRHWNEVG